MIIKFSDWLIINEAEAAAAPAAAVASTGGGGGGGGGKNGIMGQTPFLEPTPTSNAPKNFGGYKGNSGCGGGEGLRKGGASACPDNDASGQSGGPSAKKGMGGGGGGAMMGGAAIGGGKTA